MLFKIGNIVLKNRVFMSPIASIYNLSYMKKLNKWVVVWQLLSLAIARNNKKLLI